MKLHLSDHESKQKRGSFEGEKKKNESIKEMKEAATKKTEDAECGEGKKL